MSANVTLREVNQKLEDHIKSADCFFKKMESAILGSDGTKGLIVRVDRLEQVEDRRKWHIRTLWAAMVAGVGGWVFK